MTSFSSFLTSLGLHCLASGADKWSPQGFDKTGSHLGHWSVLFGDFCHLHCICSVPEQHQCAYLTISSDFLECILCNTITRGVMC